MEDQNETTEYAVLVKRIEQKLREGKSYRQVYEELNEESPFDAT